MSSVRTSLAVFVAAVAAVGCSDAAQNDLTGPAPSRSTTLALAVEQSSLDQLTRAVARALSDQGLRQRLKNDMRSAPFAEHKLQLAAYLRGNSGGILLAKMAKESGHTREELLTLLDGLGPMEFYMPVKSHRESWTGGADLLVAGAMAEGDAPVGYDLQGQRVQLSATVAPLTPTLSIVPQETFADRAMSRARSRNVNDRGGQAIGTLVATSGDGTMSTMMMTECDPYAEMCQPCSPDMLECYDDGGGLGYVEPPPPAPAPGTVQRRGISVEEFITRMRALDDHESWNYGAPEFYILLAGKYGTGTDFKNRINIPEGPWDGSSDSGNARWRNFGNISLILWDVDLGTRITVQCFEDDFNWEVTQTVGGSTEFPDKLEPGGFPVKLNYSIAFKVGSTDDDCGSSFINMRNSQGEWYYIPNGVNDDMTNPAPQYQDGTSDLKWYGYGLKRL
jgi:hypothetical protein